MAHIKDILCPDCEQVYIDETRMDNYGKCISCHRRETICNTKGLEYIPFRKLPEDEKQRLENQREKNNAWNKQRAKQTKVTKVTKVTNVGKKGNPGYSTELHTLVQSLSNCTVKEMLKEIKKQFPEYTYFTEQILRSFLYKNKYPYKSARSTNITSTNITSTVKPVVMSCRPNQIYSPEVVTKILQLANENKPVGELRQEIQKLYPDKNITVGNFNNIIHRHNIPHSSERFIAKPVQKESNNTSIRSNIIKQTVTVDKQYDKKVIEELLPELPKEVTKNLIKEEISKVQIDVDSEPERFKPIREEISNTAKIKYKQLKCDLEEDYETSDYLYVLNMLLYLVTNYERIINNRNTQHNVMNAYQEDWLHEMENTIAEEGSTYLSDKGHILRNIRRHIEYDYNDVYIMQDFLKSVNVQKLKVVIGHLTKFQTTRNNPKFVPAVDKTLLSKYGWAVNGVEKYISKKPQNIPSTQKLVANRQGVTVNDAGQGELEQQLKPQTFSKPSYIPADVLKTKKDNLYRGICYLSGAGFGTFKKWQKDYIATTENKARELMDSDLNLLMLEHKGVLITDKSLHKVSN